MTEKEIRTEFKNLVLLGNSPDCKTVREAREKNRMDGLSQEVIDGLWQNACLEDWLAELEIVLKAHFFDGINSATMREKPITIGRVMTALPTEVIFKNFVGENKIKYCQISIDNVEEETEICVWILREYRREAKDEDQPIETIKRLLKILKT